MATITTGTNESVEILFKTLREAEAQLESLKTQIAAAEAELADLEQQLVVAEKAVKDSKEYGAGVDANMALLEQKNAELQVTNAQLEAYRADQVARSQALNHELEMLRAELSALEA